MSITPLELVVVETEDDAFLGFVEKRGEDIIIRNGYVGRPNIVPLSEVDSITPADQHPDVVLS